MARSFLCWPSPPCASRSIGRLGKSLWPAFHIGSTDHTHSHSHDALTTALKRQHNTLLAGRRHRSLARKRHIMGEWKPRWRWTGRPVIVPLDRVRWAQTRNSWDWTGARAWTPRQSAWKADSSIFTAWKQRLPFNPALLTAVHYTAENTAVASGFGGLLPRHVLRL